jgi:hypothetical protein
MKITLEFDNEKDAMLALNAQSYYNFLCELLHNKLRSWRKENFTPEQIEDDLREELADLYIP